ncbi:MAG: hypothetical protein ACYDAC_03610 [Candidatus Dormibacteria bacterium]
MPWGLLTRLASMLVVARVVRSRRQRRGVGKGARFAASGAPVQRAWRNAQEAAGLAWRLVVTALFAVAASLCLAAGTSSVVLSPAWLGIVLLVFAAGFAVLALREALGARAVVRRRRLRRRDARVRGELEFSGPRVQER